MHRRLFKRQCQIVADGGDPVGVAFKESDRIVKIEARSWMTTASDPTAKRDSVVASSNDEEKQQCQKP